MRYYLLFLIILINLFSSYAHVGGEEKIIDGYKIEFVQQPEQAVVGISKLVFLLENATNNEGISNIEGWVRISKGDEILFSSSHFTSDEFGAISVSYNFLSPGDYEAKIEFRPEEKKINTDFAIEIEGKTQSSGINRLVFIFVIGIVIGFLANKLKKIKR